MPNDVNAVFNMKKIEDEKYLHNLFRNLARQKIVPLTVNLYDGKVLGGYLMVDRVKSNPVIQIEEGSKLEISEEIEVAFFVKDFYLLFKTVPVRYVEDNRYEITSPTFVYSSFRRMISRHMVEEDEKAYLVLPGSENKIKIRDINTMGLSFIYGTDELKEGTLIKNIKILLGHSTEVSVDAYVRYCVKDKQQNYVYGLVFRSLDWTENQELFSYIFERKYPQLRQLGEFEPEQIYELFGEYLKIKSKDEMDRNFEKMKSCLQSVYKNHDIASNLVYCNNGKLLSSASALRVYNKTFLGHQLVSIPEAIFNIKAKTDLYYGLSEFLMNHKHFEYYLTYFFADLSWHSEMYLKIGSYIKDSNKFFVDSFQLYECITNADINSSGGYECTPLDKPDEFIEYCSRNLSKLEIGCYSYDRDSIFLDMIKKVYKQAGLYIDREIFKVSKENEVIAYAVAECYSDGLNLFNITDMTRLYFNSKNFDIDKVIIATVEKVNEFYKTYNKEKYNLVFSYAAELKTNLSSGITLSSHPWGRVMADREGGAEYWKLLFMNFK